MFVSTRCVLGVSTASLHHLFLTRPGRIPLLPHLISLAAREVGGLRIHWASVYTLLELKHLFFPPKLDAGALLTAFLLWTFLFFQPSLHLPRHAACPKRSRPGALSTAEHKERTLRKRGRTTGDAVVGKHLPLLIKMRRFALSRGVGSRPGEQICKGRVATALQHRLLTPNSSPFIDSRLTPVSPVPPSFRGHHAETPWAVTCRRSAL